jgi:hypothetical protein
VGGGFNGEGSQLEPTTRKRYRMNNQSGGIMQNKMWMLGMILIAFFVGLMFFQNTTAQQAPAIFAVWFIDYLNH